MAGAHITTFTGLIQRGKNLFVMAEKKYLSLKNFMFRIMLPLPQTQFR